MITDRHSRAGLWFIGLVTLACAPVWAVECFMTQDGAAHAYTASLMRRLLAGDPSAAQHFAFNPWTLSNSTGHWLLALLLTLVSPFTATKVVVTLTYAGVVAAAGFLRFSTSGREGLLTSLLLGAAIGFNWLWLGGLYNFLLGAIGLGVTLALFCRWQGRLTGGRIFALSALVLLVYLSHVVTFAVLMAGLVLMAVFADLPGRRRAWLAVVMAILPAVLLAVLYGSGATEPASGSERLFPVWRRLSSAWSLGSWVYHMRTADPFFIISRRALPFSASTSGTFAIFTPLLWLLIAALALAWATLTRRANGGSRMLGRRRLPLIVLFAGCALAAAFGPDDFGTSHGTLLRERLAFIAAMLFVPLYRTEGASKALRTFVHLCLTGLILFQTAALWEYARQTSRDAVEFLALDSALEGHDSAASVVVLENSQRFPSNPTAGLSNILGVTGRTVIWDNYQLGYTLFPVVARDAVDRAFVFDLTSVNVLDQAEPSAAWEARLERLASFFASNYSRIPTVLVWRGNAQIEATLRRWYEDEPFFESGRGRLYRRRQDLNRAGSAAIPTGRSTDAPGPARQSQ